MSRLFVTASGTEVGKTFVTCALIGQLRARGWRVRALKPVVTGCGSAAGSPGDTELLLRALNLDADVERIARVSPWRFGEPLSPDMAAAREQASISLDELVRFCRANADADLTLIEGVGGVMVPLNDRHTVLDWIAALRMPALLVVGTYLGTLSHTLTAAGMLAARGVEIAGIIVNESPEQPVPAAETAGVIARFTGDVPVRVLPRVDRPEDAPDLSELITPYL